MMLSIDQNSHSLWDALPKLHALRAAGRAVRHVLEDVDVAFTSLGAAEGGEWAVVRERFHASGGQDWGAALFYNEFLGRVAVDIRRWERPLGLTFGALARRLDQPLDELFRRYAAGDTWMLIGPSYVGDRRHHRLIGDLGAAETADFLHQILRRAEDDCLRSFPQNDSRRRTGEWFTAETRRLRRFLDAGPRTLTDLYRAWLGDYLGDSVPLDLTSNLFRLDGDAGRRAVLELFLRDYDRAVELYNRAVRETDVGLHELNTAAGELPFFAFMRRDGRLVRCETFLRGGRLALPDLELPCPDGRLPIEALRRAGVEGVVGKAVLLVIQARIGPAGEPLAVVHRGSAYLPAAHRLAQLLDAEGLLPGDIKPIVRVRFRLLDRLRELDTTIHLPDHLAGTFGVSDVPARRLGECWRDVAEESRRRLEDFSDPAKREQWQAKAFPRQTAEIADLNDRKRRLAEKDSKDPQIQILWNRAKELQNVVLSGTLDHVAADWQTAQLETYDSRGAILPWCVALGGESFYNEVVSRAEITEETHEAA